MSLLDPRNADEYRLELVPAHRKRALVQVIKAPWELARPLLLGSSGDGVRGRGVWSHKQEIVILDGWNTKRGAMTDARTWRAPSQAT